MTDNEPVVETEAFRVLDWRHEQIGNMRDLNGRHFTVAQVTRLALSPNADLHGVENMLRAGCSRAHVLRICG